MIILVGSTPVVCKSKRQGAVATSTYDSEFSAMRSAVEETMAIRYSLRSLGVKVQQASNVMCDNLGVVQNSLQAGSLLKKKHVAVSYHATREAVACRAILPLKIDTHDNYADLMTKSLPKQTFWGLSKALFY